MPTSRSDATRPRIRAYAAGRLGDPAQNFQQRALAGPVAADDADDLAGLNGKRHVLERPEFGALAGEIAASAGSLFRRRAKKRSASSRMVRALNCPSR